METALYISDVEPGKPANIVGKIVRKYPINTVEKEDGVVRILKVLLRDKTGTIALTFFNDDALRFDDFFDEGDIIKVIASNGDTIKEYNGRHEIVFRKYGVRIIPIESEIDDDRYTDVVDLEVGGVANYIDTTVDELEGKKYVRITGTIIRAYSIKVTDNGKVVFNFALNDDTGTIRCVAFDDVAFNILGVEKDTVVEKYKELVEELGNDAKKVMVKHFNPVGKELTVEGRVKYDEYLGMNVLIIHDSREPDWDALYSAS